MAPERMFGIEVTEENRASLKQFRAELMRSRSLRELSRRAEEFAREHPEEYARIYEKRYGHAPELI